MFNRVPRYRSFKSLLEGKSESEGADTLKQIVKKSYPQFVAALRANLGDGKVLAAITAGREDGKPEDERVSFPSSVTYIRVGDLRPTQNEVDVDASLAWQLQAPEGGTRTQEIIMSGGRVQLGGPILTLNGEWVIDGHHRWSQVFCLNPDAQIACLDMVTREGVDPIDFLKAVQLAIAAVTRNLPSAVVRGQNLFGVKRPVLTEYVLTGRGSMKGFSGISDAVAEVVSGGEGKDAAALVIWANVQKLQASARPPRNAPERGMMPQTDAVLGSAEFAGTMGSGSINFKEPFAVKEAASPSQRVYVIQYGRELRDVSVLLASSSLSTAEVMSKAGVRDLSGGYQVSSFAEGTPQYKKYQSMKASHGSRAIADAILGMKKLGESRVADVLTAEGIEFQIEEASRVDRAWVAKRLLHHHNGGKSIDKTVDDIMDDLGVKGDSARRKISTHIAASLPDEGDDLSPKDAASLASELASMLTEGVSMGYFAAEYKKRLEHKNRMAEELKSAREAHSAAIAKLKDVKSGTLSKRSAASGQTVWELEMEVEQLIYRWMQDTGGGGDPSTVPDIRDSIDALELARRAQESVDSKIADAEKRVSYAAESVSLRLDDYRRAVDSLRDLESKWRSSVKESLLLEGDLREAHIEGPFNKEETDAAISKRAGARRLSYSSVYREMVSRLPEMERIAGPVFLTQVRGGSHYVSATVSFKQGASITVPFPDNWVTVQRSGKDVNVYFDHFTPLGIDPWAVVLGLLKGDSSLFDLAVKRHGLSLYCKSLDDDNPTVRMKELNKWKSESAGIPELKEGVSLIEDLQRSLRALYDYARSGGR